MTENIVTKTEFAKILNRKPSYVSELVKYGRVVLDESGKKIVVDASLKLIEESADLSKAGVVERHEKARAEKEKTELPKYDDEIDDLDDEINENGTYHDHKTTNEKYKALKAKMEFKQSMGLLLVAEDVVKTVIKAVSIIRTRFEALPDILSEQLAAESDPQKIKSMLRDYIESFLTELSQLFKKLGAV